MGLLGNFSYLYNWKTGNQKHHKILVTTRTSYCSCLGLCIILCWVFCFVCLRLVSSCAPNIDSFLGFSILDCPFGFSNVYFQSQTCTITCSRSARNVMNVRMTTSMVKTAIKTIQKLKKPTLL
jgi:hypothetical protein